MKVQSVALYIINSHIELCNDCNVLLKTFFVLLKYVHILPGITPHVIGPIITVGSTHCIA